MEKTKKIGLVLLTIYVTVATIAAALFGTLYFTGLSKDENFKFSAKNLVNRACYDLGLISEQQYNQALTNTSKQNVSANAFTYKDFVGDEFVGSMYAGMANLFADMGLLYSKFAFDGNFEEGKLYQEEAEGFGKLGIFYKTNKKSVEVKIFSMSNEIYSMTIRLTQGENLEDWEMKMTVIVWTGWDVEDDIHVASIPYYSINISCEDGNVYLFDIDIFNYEWLDPNSPTQDTKIIRNLTSLDALQDYYSYRVISNYCNLKTHKYYAYSNLSGDELEEAEEVFENDEDKMTVIKRVLAATANEIIDGNTRYADKEFANISFYQEANEQLQSLHPDE